jgi:predicted O-methyltransferase YrrM
VALAPPRCSGSCRIASGPFFDIVVGAFDRLDAGAFVGSLIGVLVLLAVPLVLLGTITPWALRPGHRRRRQTGRSPGGCTRCPPSEPHRRLPVGARAHPARRRAAHFLVFAAALALTAAAGARVPRPALAVPALLLLALLLPPGLTKPGEDGARVIEERETTYQYLRVLQDGPRRLLELNEGQAVHSIYDPATVLTGGVWDGYLSVPRAVLDAPPRSMAMLGNAAGTVSRAYARFYPGTRIDGVEIDGEVTEAGRDFFDLGANRRLTTYTEDARPFLRRVDRRYDLIGIDAYRQPYIPFYLATEEFFDLTRRRLNPGGAVVVNIGHPEGQDALEQTITRTLKSSFRHVARYAIEDTSTLLVASDTAPSRARLEAAAAEADPELRTLLQETAQGLEGPLSGGQRFTDDKAPVEWLIDASIVRYAAGGGEDEE